jgi:hypothetical protein
MEGDAMAEKGSREEQEAGVGEYEPPAVTPLGSIEELTARPDAGSIDDGG